MNATAATAAATGAIPGPSRPVSAEAGMVVVQAIGIRYTNRNRSAPGYAEAGKRVACEGEPEHDVRETPDVEPAERDEPLRVHRLGEDQVQIAAPYLAGEPADAGPQHGLDQAAERVEDAQQHDDLPVVPAA